MSRAYRVASECPSGKITWMSEAKVRKFIRGRRYHKRGLRAYRCSLCRLWHTTSQHKRG